MRAFRVATWQYAGLSALAMGSLSAFGYFLVRFGVASPVPYGYGVVGWTLMVFVFVLLNPEAKAGITKPIDTWIAAGCSALIAVVAYGVATNETLGFFRNTLWFLMAVMAGLLLLAAFLSLFVREEKESA